MGPVAPRPPSNPICVPVNGRQKEKVVRDLSQLRPQAQVGRGSAAQCGRALGLLSDHRQKESLPLLL